MHPPQGGDNRAPWRRGDGWDECPNCAFAASERMNAVTGGPSVSRRWPKSHCFGPLPCLSPVSLVKRKSGVPAETATRLSGFYISGPPGLALTIALFFSRWTSVSYYSPPPPSSFAPSTSSLIPGSLTWWKCGLLLRPQPPGSNGPSIRIQKPSQNGQLSPRRRPQGPDRPRPASPC